MKILSFNVNGIRAIVKKNFIEDMRTLKCDIVCLQETKATVEQVKEAIKDLNEYEVYGNEADKKGYSGTAILTKKKPLSVAYKLNIDEHDHEGRIVCLEYETVYLLNVYVPNSGSQLARLNYRQKWDKDFLNYIKKLEEKKPVIVCGDFNVAHHDIDLARPKPNFNRSAGYMQEEIDGMNNYEKNDLIDTFRYFNADEVKYTWWSYRAGARQKNVGWRIDYFLVSKSLLNRVTSAFILNDVFGSDHCPLGVEIK